MEQLLDRSSTFKEGLETSNSERLVDKAKLDVRLGHLALSLEVIGNNDPLNHLFQYLEKGDDALAGIEEDFVTDVAERLPKNPFVNQVGFEFTGDDFVSVKDKVSMNSMTANNLQFYREESVVNPGMLGELARAEVESKEGAKLANWFTEAKNGEFLIFESLPIGEQKFAVSRVYQKKADGTLEGTFISMHNSSIDHFNRLRAHMAPGTPACITKLGLLSNQYEFYNQDVTSSGDFVDYYVGSYDYFLSEQDGRSHSFGIVVDDGTVLQDGLEKARNQPSLTSVYTDTIKALASGNGRVSQDLLRLNTRLGLNFELIDDQRLTLQTIHKILAKVITGVVSVIDRADVALLEKLSSADASDNTGYGAVSDYGGQASAEGETYSSGGCPEYGRSGANEGDNAIGSERSKMEKAYIVGANKLDDFGKAKMGICRISGCPSHGTQKYLKERTLVGGCDICVGCHILFKKGKSPSIIYKDQQQRLQKKQAEEQVIRERAEEHQKKANDEQLRLLNLKNVKKVDNRSTQSKP